MPLVEIEIRQVECARLANFILQKSPIPVPTLQLLGPQRLLSRPFRWQQPLLGESPPDFAAPPGTLPMRAAVTIAHVSLDELAADAAAAGTATECTAWLLLRAEVFRPTPGEPASLILLRVDLLRLETAGRAPQVFSPPLPIGSQTLPPIEGVADARGAAVLFRDEVVTVRIAVGADEGLFAPPQSVLAQENSDDQWIIRVAGEVFAAQVQAQLAAFRLPPRTHVETPAFAAWGSLPLVLWTTPTGPDWGVSGSLEVEQVDACADVDVSVDIGVLLGFTPQFPARPEIDLALRVRCDVSDWDSARCWASRGGIASLGLSAIGELAASVVDAVKTSIAIGDFVRLEAGKTVTGSASGGGFTPVASDEDTAWFTRTIPLPALPAGAVTSVTVDGRGLVVRGVFPFLAPLDHTVAFLPEGPPLAGHWHGSYSCRERKWKTTFEVASIVVHDRILDNRDPAALRTVEGPPITIFPTTTFRHPGPVDVVIPPAPGIWFYDKPPFPTGAPMVTVRRSEPPRVRERVMFILHTSAGIRRYDIGPVPPISGRAEEPSPLVLALHETNCRQTTRLWTPKQRIEWLVDPPPFDFGFPPLRQWMLTLRGMPGQPGVIVHQQGSEAAVSARHDFGGAEEGFLEVVSDQEAALDVEHTLDQSEAEVRVTQRWLVPTAVVALPRAARGLRLGRTADDEPVLLVDFEEVTRALVNDELVDWGEAPPPAGELETAGPRSLTLANGQVAVVRGEELVLAVPWSPRGRA